MSTRQEPGWADGAWDAQDEAAARKDYQEPQKAKVVLFKPSGTYYTTEEWEIPAEVPREANTNGVVMGAPTRRVIGPYDMLHSKDFRRIDGGPVLIESQEPWGWPHLFPATEVQS